MDSSTMYVVIEHDDWDRNAEFSWAVGPFDSEEAAEDYFLAPMRTAFTKESAETNAGDLIWHPDCAELEDEDGKPRPEGTEVPFVLPDDQVIEEWYADYSAGNPDEENRHVSAIRSPERLR